jgi:RNA polymerase sigma-70 factor (ECF subfamily)
VEVEIGLSLGSKIARMATGSALAGILETSALVEAARGGDRFAFGQLYDRYARMVHGILLARVPHAEVEDLVHDVFLLALNRLTQLRQPAAFGGWLAQIARNRANDFHRRPQETAELLEESHGAHDPDRMQTLAALAAIRALPEAYRETLILRLVEGMSGPEIAERTGLTPGSVRVNLHRGMKQLREHLARSSGHE